MLSLSGWRKLVLETLALLVLMAALRHGVFGINQVTGMPHPYWFPVLLASSQYGVSGGTIAAVAAGVAYLFELSPQSAAQDFYAYAAAAAVQPAAWLATALILGGLRSLHIYQTAELAERLAACERCASDLADGFARATAEVAALERRIASETRSVAALSRSLSKVDLSDRWAATVSFGEVFRVGAGATTFTIYLKNSDGYVPAFAIEDDAIRPTQSIKPLQPATIDALTHENTRCGSLWKTGPSEPGTTCRAILIPPSGVAPGPLAVIVCRGPLPSQDAIQFDRRSNELSCAFATILSVCPERPSGACQ